MLFYLDIEIPRMIPLYLMDKLYSTFYLSMISEHISAAY